MQGFHVMAVLYIIMCNASKPTNMKKNRVLWLTTVLILLTACDPASEARYTIRNESDSLVTIEVHHNMYYELHTKDTLVCYDSNVQPSFVLLKHEAVVVRYGWMSAAVEEHTAFWNSIASIKIGSRALPQELWKENCWQSSKSGGHLFSFGEEWDYVLTITDDIL